MTPRPPPGPNDPEFLRARANLLRVANERELASNIPPARTERQALGPKCAADVYAGLDRATALWMTIFRPRGHIPAFDGLTEAQCVAIAQYFARVVACELGGDTID